MSDEWDNCYSGDIAEAYLPGEVQHLFCAVCKNDSCERAQGVGSAPSELPNDDGSSPR